jgi:hypothetical protein
MFRIDNLNSSMLNFNWSGRQDVAERKKAKGRLNNIYFLLQILE